MESSKNLKYNEQYNTSNKKVSGKLPTVALTACMQKAIIIYWRRREPYCFLVTGFTGNLYDALYLHLGLGFLDVIKSHHNHALSYVKMAVTS